MRQTFVNSLDEPIEATAIAAGQRAAIVEEDRPDVFSARVERLQRR